MYAKLFTTIYQGTLRGNSHGLLVFTNLLAHCDKDGIADIHPRAIAEEVGLSVEQVRAALDLLEMPDEESRSPEKQGRRIVRIDDHRSWGWLVVNYCKYRAIRNEDDRREQNRAAQERHRQRQQSKPPSAEVSQGQPHSAHTEAEADTEAEANTETPPPNPRKRGKSPAKFDAACPEGVDAQVWADWLHLRKSKRAPVTKTVIDGATKQADIAGLPLVEFLRIWCRRGTQGLEAAWLQPQERASAASYPQDRKARQLETAALMTGAAPAAIQPRMAVVRNVEAIDVAAQLLG